MVSNVMNSAPALQRLEDVLEKMSAWGHPGTHAYSALFPDTARQEARDADVRRAKNSPRGTVDGLLVSCKALFDIAGKVTTAGSAILSRRDAAQRDAAVITRLKEAGAVIVGATQMTEFAFSAVGTNPHYPLAGNPTDYRRIPGGSSSGAAVSVGEGLADIAIGSDTGGSLRIPAALCGLVGFKPTASRVSRQGVFPLSQTLDSVGPIARNVALCAAADAVLTGEQVAGPAAEADSFRLIVPAGRLFDQCVRDVQNAFERAIASIRQTGIKVEEGSLDPVLDALSEIDNVGTFPSIELAATLRSLHFSDLTEVDPNTRARIEASSHLSAIDYLHMVRLRSRLVSSFASEMEDDNFYILPTVPILAPLISEVQTADQFRHANELLLRNPRVANLLDCPSISLPMPTSHLPVGLMLIGKRLSDRRLLSVAARVEKALWPSKDV